MLDLINKGMRKQLETCSFLVPGVIAQLIVTMNYRLTQHCVLQSLFNTAALVDYAMVGVPRTTNSVYTQAHAYLQLSGLLAARGPSHGGTTACFAHVLQSLWARIEGAATTCSRGR